MAVQREEIVVNAGFNNTALASGLRTAGQKVTDWATHVGSAIAGAFAAEKIFEFEKHLLDFAKNISLTAERLGVTTDEVQKLQFAGAMTGVQLNTIATALDRLARAKEKVLSNDKGSEKLFQSFERFGITIKDIEKLKPQELFDKISESVSKTGVNAQVTSDAMELFGKSGGRLIPLLKEFREQSEKAPIISAEDLENIRKASEELEGLKMRFEVLMAMIQVRLFNPKTWKEFWYGITHPFTETQDIFAKFDDPDKMDAAHRAAYYKAHPEKIKSSIPSESSEDSGGTNFGGGSSTGGGGSSKSGTADLYHRRAQLLREIANVGKLPYSEFLEKQKELYEIEDQLAVKNAPNELSRLQVERGQTARDLKHEQNKLLIGDDARAAQKEKVQSLADRLKGFDMQISDFNKSNLEKLAIHANKQTTAMEKIAGAVNGTSLNVKIPSN